jgi:hypothetical protein
MDQFVAALTRAILNLLRIGDAAGATSCIALQNAPFRLAAATVAQLTQKRQLLADVASPDSSACCGSA